MRLSGELIPSCLRPLGFESRQVEKTISDSERLAHRRAAIRSNGVAAFSITEFARRQGVGTL